MNINALKVYGHPARNRSNFDFLQIDPTVGSNVIGTLYQPELWLDNGCISEDAVDREAR